MAKENDLASKTEVLVRFNEADPLGIVWHGHYIQYFEDGREHFGNLHGIGYLDIFEKGFVTPVVQVECSFKKPLRYGDTVIIETLYIPSEAAKIQFSYRLYNKKTNDLVATGTTTQVFLDKSDSGLQLINPPFFEDWKRKFIES